MAQNSSQPFHGFPFAYPPPIQRPVSSAQVEDQRVAPLAQPPPALHGLQNIPGLQQPSIPGLNSQAQGQNGQQPPFAPAIWPPQLPSDPSAWLPFFQNGAMPPPPLPGMPFPLPSFPPNLQSPATAALPPYISPQPHVSASTRTHDLMESDREDGELSEGEVLPQSVAKINGLTHREPPRSIPQEPNASSGQRAKLVERIQKKRDDARQFIRLLNSNNIGYRTLADEHLDIELLRNLYQSVNLPSEPAPLLPPKANNDGEKPLAQPSYSNMAFQATSGAEVQPHKSTATIATNAARSPLAKSAASPTMPVDRKDYIARLQAAKMAKQGIVNKSSASTAAAVQMPAASNTTFSAKLPVTDEQRARNTELIKQRLEAIKAKQKPITTLHKDPVPSSFVTASREQSPPTTQPKTSNSHPSANNPTFPGIPGLFVSNTSAIHENIPRVTNPPMSIPQKRPATSEPERLTLLGSTPATRPLDQSPPHNQEDSMIIEVSDDESDGSEMDIDDDQTASKPVITSQASFQNRRQAPALHTDFSSRSTSTKPASPIDVSHQQNPTTLAREKELEDKEKQLAAMRLTLKRKLAEKREKDKAAAAAAAAVITESPAPIPPVIPVPALTSQNYVTSRPSAEGTGAIHSINGRSLNTTPTPAETVISNKLSRRAEIQSRLPTLDAEVANNNSRMVELTGEMEQLVAQNEKITKDKEKLELELESLDIDSENTQNAEVGSSKDVVGQAVFSESSPTAYDVHASHSHTLGSHTVPVIPSQKETSNDNGNQEKFSTAQGFFDGNFMGLPGLGQTSHARRDNTITLPQNPAVGKASEPQAAAETPGIRQNILEPVQPFEARKSSNLAITTTDMHGSATPLEDDEDFYSSVPADEDHHTDTARSPLRALSRQQSPLEQGEIDMSESSEDEDEYVPEEPLSGFNTYSKELPMPEPEHESSIATSQVSTEDEEAYEPPDIGQDVSNTRDGIGALGTILPASHVGARDGAMEIVVSSSEQSNSKDSDEETASEPVMDSSISANVAVHQGTKTANKIGHQVQPDLTTPLPTSEAMPTPSDQGSTLKFTPYASPLRMFKSYRYHPSYAHDVAGGFLSLTFSHQIDPEKTLCQYESAGGTCNDEACPDQHFRDLNITGEKLLVQLGTANPGKSAEERQRWNDGLRVVLKELRTKNIKDPNGIAMEIAKYRRQFLDDDTRVVNL